VAHGVPPPRAAPPLLRRVVLSRTSSLGFCQGHCCRCCLLTLAHGRGTGGCVAARRTSVPVLPRPCSPGSHSFNNKKIYKIAALFACLGLRPSPSDSSVGSPSLCFVYHGLSFIRRCVFQVSSVATGS
jgi:hypothetical protein